MKTEELKRFKFREAVNSDYDQILKLKKQVHEFHYLHKPDFYKNTTVPLNKSEFKSLIDNKLSNIFIIEKDEKVCSYIITKTIIFQDNSLIIY